MRKCEQNLLSRKRLKAFESGTLSKPAYGFGISVGCLYTKCTVPIRRSVDNPTRIRVCGRHTAVQAAYRDRENRRQKMLSGEIV